MNFDDIVHDRRYIAPDNIPAIINGLQRIVKTTTNRGQVVVPQKMSLHIRAIRSTTDWEDRFAQANLALSYVEEVLARSHDAGKQWDLRNIEEGDWLPDGTIVRKCPTCGKMGIIRDELDEHSYCAHIVVVKPSGYEVKERCVIQAS